MSHGNRTQETIVRAESRVRNASAATSLGFGAGAHRPAFEVAARFSSSPTAERGETIITENGSTHEQRQTSETMPRSRRFCHRIEANGTNRKRIRRRRRKSRCKESGEKGNRPEC